MTSRKGIKARVRRHNPDGPLKPSQWLIRNPAFVDTPREWSWGTSKDTATIFDICEAELAISSQGGWPVVIEDTTKEPERIGTVRADTARRAAGKSQGRLSNAERVAIARDSRRKLT